MARELRLAAALCGQKAEGDHFPLGERQAGAGIVVAEAVGGQPAVDVARLPRFQHLRAEDVGLRLRALFKPVFHGGRGLAFEREGHAALRQNLVCAFQKRQHAADAEVVDSLIDDLLDHHGRHARIQRGGQHFLKRVDALL